MYFKERIKEHLKQSDIALFIDMDGVIADYNINGELEFKNKRPLKDNINKIEQVSKLNGVEVYILSICRRNDQIDDKNKWLDEHAPYFKKENRIIISKEDHIGKSSKELKTSLLSYELRNIKDKQIILVDDDNAIIKSIRADLEDVIVYQDSILID